MQWYSLPWHDSSGVDGRVERLLLFHQSWSKKSRERRLVKVISHPLENKQNVCFGLNHHYHLETRRRKLRKDLKCKSFRWYLETIYPESQVQHLEKYRCSMLEEIIGLFSIGFHPDAFTLRAPGWGAKWGEWSLSGYNEQKSRTEGGETWTGK